MSERRAPRMGSKAHLRHLRTTARQALGTGTEPPTLQQLITAAAAIDQAIHAITLSSHGRLLVSDGWGHALAPDEFLRRLRPECVCRKPWPCPKWEAAGKPSPAEQFAALREQGVEPVGRVHYQHAPKPPSVRLVREHNDLDHEFTSGAGAKPPEYWDA